MNSDLTDEQVVKDRNDLEMLRRPHLWPKQLPHPCIFVKQKLPDGRTGLLYERPDKTLVVFILMPPAAKGQTIDYPDAEHVLLDGWLVD